MLRHRWDLDDHVEIILLFIGVQHVIDERHFRSGCWQTRHRLANFVPDGSGLVLSVCALHDIGNIDVTAFERLYVNVPFKPEGKVFTGMFHRDLLSFNRYGNRRAV
ncbi:hypothetical protein D3C80_1235350 [compost metagenome]